jgi:MoaA/NifB/PqqE/SkfB family radical SAM enzyme
MQYIKTINWALTYKCNLKCTHCDIWENPYKNSFNIEKIKEIVTSKTIKESYNFYKNEFDIGIS